MNATATKTTLEMMEESPSSKVIATVRVETTAQYRRDIDAEFALMLQEALTSERAADLPRFTDVDDFRRFLKG